MHLGISSHTPSSLCVGVSGSSNGLTPRKVGAWASVSGTRSPAPIEHSTNAKRRVGHESRHQRRPAAVPSYVATARGLDRQTRRDRARPTVAEPRGFRGCSPISVRAGDAQVVRGDPLDARLVGRHQLVYGSSFRQPKRVLGYSPAATADWFANARDARSSSTTAPKLTAAAGAQWRYAATAKRCAATERQSPNRPATAPTADHETNARYVLCNKQSRACIAAVAGLPEPYGHCS
jgi:hypothetical protein